MPDEEFVRPGLCHHLPRDMPIIKAKLRAKVEKLTFREIRRQMEPIYTCIALELEEDGFPKTGAFYQQLLAKEVEIHDQMVGLKTKKLKTEPELLEKLISVVKNSEAFLGFDLPVEKVEAYFAVAVDISTSSSDFEWVVEDVLMQALKDSRRIQLDDGRTQAKAIYYLGKYYLKNDMLLLAMEKLEAVYIMTENKSWTISDPETTFLHFATCSEYAKALVQYANQIVLNTQEKALQTMEKALVLVKKSNFKRMMGFVYDQYGLMLTKIGNHEDAYFLFDESISNYRAVDPFPLCEVELHISDCLVKINQWEDSANHIEKAIEIAEKNKYTRLLAEAYVLRGHVELNIGKTTNASENYIKSVELYNELGLGMNVRFARSWAAASLAQNVIGSYIDTIILSDTADYNDNDYRQRLLQWADNRQPFWAYSDPSRESQHSDINILQDQQRKSINQMTRIVSYISISRESTSTNTFRDYREKELSRGK